jgi:hypothetical protein
VREEAFVVKAGVSQLFFLTSCKINLISHHGRTNVRHFSGDAQLRNMLFLNEFIIKSLSFAITVILPGSGS